MSIEATEVEVYEVDGILISSDGEILEVPKGMDETGIITVLVSRRHQARQDEKSWEAFRKNLDRVLLRMVEGRKATFGEVIVSVRANPYDVTDRDRLARDFADTEWRLDEIEAIFRAAKFKKDELPPLARKLYDEATEVKTTAPWIETTFVKRVPPQRTRVVRSEEEEA